MTTFNELAIGDTFDFISPDRVLNSYLRCKKTSSRRYEDDLGQVHRIVRIHCKVYNVNKANDAMAELHFVLRRLSATLDALAQILSSQGKEGNNADHQH
jgi:hypothetical protein